MEALELVIEAGRTERQYWRDVWRFRELFYFLTWRDVLVRYKQTVIGVAWVLLRPLLATVVFTFFARVVNLSSGNVPYPLLMFTALIPWQFFSSALGDCSNSLINNGNLISKVYFPRLIVPASSIVTAMVDLLVTFVLLAGMMLFYRFSPDYRILALPVFIAMAFAAALGPGLWLAAIMVRYRDFRFVVPFLMQFGFYVSPVVYPTSLVHEKLAGIAPWLGHLYALNPMVAVIDGFRWCLLRGEPGLDPVALLVSAVAIGASLVIGIRHFRNTERTFADVI